MKAEGEATPQRLRHALPHHSPSPLRRPPLPLRDNADDRFDVKKPPLPPPPSPPPEPIAWGDGEDSAAVDRDWYTADEEGGLAYDDESRAFILPSNSAPPPRAPPVPTRVKRVSARAVQVQEDNSRWEENRMFQSGVVTATSVDLDFTSETEQKVQLQVLDMRPPFLDGRTAFTTQREQVQVVRDPTSDLSVIAKKGSALLVALREKGERNQMKDKFWEVAGNHIGNVIGVTAPPVKAEGGKGEAEGGEVDYRQSSQFAEHLKEANTAQSDFSASKSIAAQREYLPIYTCKDELMRVIRDNPIVVIVGETGSGYTTAYSPRSPLAPLLATPPLSSHSPALPPLCYPFAW